LADCVGIHASLPQGLKPELKRSLYRSVKTLRHPKATVFVQCMRRFFSCEAVP